MVIHVARRMEEGESLLTDADRATGDGDHGVGMARGFEAVRRELEDSPAGTVGELLDATGRTLLASVGGASGILFGMFFRGGAAALGGRETFDADALSLFLKEGTAEVRKRGKAAPGDKTMVGRARAGGRSRCCRERWTHWRRRLSAASEAARSGVEDTKGNGCPHGQGAVARRAFARAPRSRARSRPL